MNLLWGQSSRLRKPTHMHVSWLPNTRLRSPATSLVEYVPSRQLVPPTSCIYIYIYICMYIYIYITYVCMYLCIHTYIHAYIHTYTHTHIHTITLHNISLHNITITLHLHYITLHHITLHLHDITLHTHIIHIYIYIHMSLPPFHQTVINQQPSSQRPSQRPFLRVEVLAGLRLHQNHPGIQAFGLGALGNLATAEDNCAATGHGSMGGMGWLLDEQMPDVFLKVARTMHKKMMQQWWRTTFFWEVLVVFRFLPSRTSVRLVSSMTADEPLPGDSEGRSHWYGISTQGGEKSLGWGKVSGHSKWLLLNLNVVQKCCSISPIK